MITDIYCAFFTRRYGPQCRNTWQWLLLEFENIASILKNNSERSLSLNLKTSLEITWLGMNI